MTSSPTIDVVVHINMTVTHSGTEHVVVELKIWSGQRSYIDHWREKRVRITQCCGRRRLEVNVDT